MHRVKVVDGEIGLDAKVHAEVDATRRPSIESLALRDAPGARGVRGPWASTAAQAGSLNAPGRLRFDFTSPTGAVPPDVLAEVEEEVNDVLLHDRRRAAERP